MKHLSLVGYLDPCLPLRSLKPELRLPYHLCFPRKPPSRVRRSLSVNWLCWSTSAPGCSSRMLTGCHSPASLPPHEFRPPGQPSAPFPGSTVSSVGFPCLFPRFQKKPELPCTQTVAGASGRSHLPPGLPPLQEGSHPQRHLCPSLLTSPPHRVCPGPLLIVSRLSHCQGPWDCAGPGTDERGPQAPVVGVGGSRHAMHVTRGLWPLPPFLAEASGKAVCALALLCSASHSLPAPCTPPSVPTTCCHHMADSHSPGLHLGGRALDSAPHPLPHLRLHLRTPRAPISWPQGLAPPSPPGAALGRPQAGGHTGRDLVPLTQCPCGGPWHGVDFPVEGIVTRRTRSPGATWGGPRFAALRPEPGPLAAAGRVRWPRGCVSAARAGLEREGLCKSRMPQFYRDLVNGRVKCRS